MSRILKRLGIWKEFGWSKMGTSLNEVELFNEGTFTNDSRAVEYLENGPMLVSMRTIIRCPVCHQYIGSPGLYTDGKYAWSQAYLFYIKKGMIKLDKELDHRIKVERKYKVPKLSKEDISDIFKELVPYA